MPCAAALSRPRVLSAAAAFPAVFALMLSPAPAVLATAAAATMSAVMSATMSAAMSSTVSSSTTATLLPSSSSFCVGERKQHE